MNVKLGVSKTYTSPQFKELINMLYEEVTQVYRGNNYVYESTNWNADLKWEYFPNEGELISATVFGKRIENPINSIFINSTSQMIFHISILVNKQKYLVLNLNLKRIYTILTPMTMNLHISLLVVNISIINTNQDLNAQKSNR